MSNEKPWVLGISSSHNGSACLLHGDEIVTAIQEERLLRHKRAEHPAAEPTLAIQYCLEAGKISAAQLDAVAVCTTWPLTMSRDDASLNPILQTVRNEIPIFSLPHHLGHAIGAFATSGFDEASILIVDGNGSRLEDLPKSEAELVPPAQLSRHSGPNRTPIKEIISIYHADGSVIRPVYKHVSSASARAKAGMGLYGSLGDMYGFVGKQIFGSFLEGPGKVMGLAPYGVPQIPTSEFFSYTDGEFIFHEALSDKYLHAERWPNNQNEYLDLAASAQRAIEDALKLLQGISKELTSSTRLCYAGGVALNSVANEKMLDDRVFEQVFIMPAAEDSGPAIGAAYHALWSIRGRRSAPRQLQDSCGRHYSTAEIAVALKRAPGISARRCDNLIDEAANLLAEGKILGWFQGGSELGPRSLGQRSILCDPRLPQMKDVLNANVKYREGFRPFAPVILQEYAKDWFESASGDYESPFMLRVLKFKEQQRSKVPAVCHVDGTGRVQTLSREAHPRLHDLISAFYDRTGVPILLNTSFNIAGEPIVETPEDALWCFRYTGIDFCVLDEFIVDKDRDFDPILDNHIRLTARLVSLERPTEKHALVLNGNAISSRTITDPFSAHLDSKSAESMANLLVPAPRTRLQTLTPWGETKRFFSGNLVPLLKLTDGTRTGRQVYEEFVKEYPDFPISIFTRLIASLKRVGAVELCAQEGYQKSKSTFLEDTSEPLYSKAH